MWCLNVIHLIGVSAATLEFMRCSLRNLVIVNLIGVEFTCLTFRDGHNIVSCKINKTAVEAAECKSLQDNVSLEKTISSRRNPQVISFTERFNLSHCRPVQEPIADSCWCNESNGEIFEYKCDFVANRSKDIDARLECKICTLPKNPLEVNTHDTCKRMRFGGSSDVAPGSDGSLNVGLIAGLSVASVFLLVIIAAIALKRHRYQMHDKYNSTPVIRF